MKHIKSVKRLLILAPALAMLAGGTAYADEKTIIDEIHLNIESVIEAGSYSAEVEVESLDEEYSVQGVEVLNFDGRWVGGTTPRVQIRLEVDDEDEYAFASSSEITCDFEGEDASLVSAKRQSSGAALLVTVTLPRLDDEDLDVYDARWDESCGYAVWSGSSEKAYQIELIRNGSVIRTETVRSGSGRYYDFSWAIANNGSGTYKFRVRVVGSGSVYGPWESSESWKVSSDEAVGILNSRGGSYYMDDDDDFDDDEDDDDDRDSYDGSRYGSSNDDQDVHNGPGIGSSGSTKYYRYADDEEDDDDEDDRKTSHASATSSGSSSSRSSSGSTSSSAKTSDSPHAGGSSTSASPAPSSAGGNLVSDGKNYWCKDNTGWWYTTADGRYLKNCWASIDGRWYCFNESGYLRFGWIEKDGKWCYCGEDGAMLVNAKTPDGYYVGGDGGWIQ